MPFSDKSNSIEYHYLTILIHRPWTSRRLQPLPTLGRGHRHARKICVNSACEMASILLIFEKRFGYRRLNVETLQILPSAALILIFATVSTPEDDEDAPQIAANLNTVLRAIDDLSNTYVSAREHLESLLLIQQSWRSTSKGKHRKRSIVGSRLEVAESEHQPKRGRLV
jgi:hypothetical protein